MTETITTAQQSYIAKLISEGRVAYSVTPEGLPMTTEQQAEWGRVMDAAGDDWSTAGRAYKQSLCDAINAQRATLRDRAAVAADLTKAEASQLIDDLKNAD